MNTSTSNNIGAFNGSSLKEEKDKSHRSFDCYEEETELQKLGKNNCNDIVFKILVDSRFIYEFKKVDNQTNANFVGIQIQRENENLNFNDIEGFNSNNDILNVNYNKFLGFLNSIINDIKTKFSNSFDFIVTLAFKVDCVEKQIFHIDCFYYLDIPNENQSKFKDFDILNNKELKGFQCLLSEINARRD